MILKKTKSFNPPKYFVLQFEIALLGSDQLGAVICETWRHRYVIVDAVMEGSVAERVGLRIGDRIFEVNGVRSPTLHTIGELFKQGPSVRLTVYRKHTERTLKVFAQNHLECAECGNTGVDRVQLTDMSPIQEGDAMANDKSNHNLCASDDIHSCRWRTWSQFLCHDDSSNRYRERYCVTTHKDDDQECVDHNNHTPIQSTPVKNLTFVKDGSFQQNKENYKPLQQDSSSLLKVKISPKTTMYNKVYFSRSPDNRKEDIITWEEKVGRVLRKLPVNKPSIA